MNFITTLPRMEEVIITRDDTVFNSFVSILSLG
ncbi:hypothetical protein BAMA111019_19395 [Bacillus manliponensis]